MAVHVEHRVGMGLEQVERGGGLGGGGDYATGSTFTDANGNAARWVMFRPDGVPVGFTAACVTGQLGSGAGGIYVTNANRDYAVVVTPLGGAHVRGFERGAGAWMN